MLTLQWRQVDFNGGDRGEVRLDAGTTKNNEGRVFPFTAALRELLEEQGRRRTAPIARGAARTTSAGPPCATSSELAYLSGSRCR